MRSERSGADGKLAQGEEAALTKHVFLCPFATLQNFAFKQSQSTAASRMYLSVLQVNFHIMISQYSLCSM